MPQHGLTEATANARFQERSNAVTPLVTALALVPMAMILGLLQRDRPRRDHFTFLLVMSNAVWLVSLPLLPISVVSETAAGTALFAGRYLYLGIGYFATYGARNRARHGGAVRGVRHRGFRPVEHVSLSSFCGDPGDDLLLTGLWSLV